MSSESLKNKKLDLVKFYDVKEGLSDFTEEKRVPFILRYWVDIVQYNGEQKERYKYLPLDSGWRKQCEDVMKHYKIDGKNIRFEGNMVYVSIKPVEFSEINDKIKPAKRKVVNRLQTPSQYLQSKTPSFANV